MAEGKKKTKKLGAKGTLFLVVFLIVAMAFLPTSLLLFIGMLPSLAVLIVRSKTGPRASTVAAMNLAGCVPFIFKLWAGANDFEASVDIVTNSASISVIYVCAAFGYLIDWVVTGLMSSFLYQKGLNRMKAIKKRQAVLVEQWGEEVAGDLPVSKKD